MIPIWLGLVIFVILLVYKYFEYDRNYWKHLGVPGPKPSIIFGHYWSLKLPFKQSILQLQNWTKQYGPFYGIFEGARKILVISDLEMIHEVLVTKFDLFEARKLNAVADEKSLFNEGSILHCTSFRWKRLRNMAATYFNAINVKKTMSVVHELVKECGANMKPYAKSEEIFDIVPYLQKLTDDIFVRLIFGDEGIDTAYFSAMFAAIDAKKNRIEKIFSIVSTICPFSKPILNWINSNLKTNYFFNNQLYKNIAKKIEKRKEELKNLPKNIDRLSYTYLDHLLTTEICEKNDGDHEIKEYFYSGKQVTRYLLTSEIVSALMNMLYAGHKTSARALISVVDCLAKNTSAQKRLFNEELADLRDDLTFESLENLTYLNHVIREALRLFPLGSEHVARKCNSNTTIGGKIKLESGNFVMVDVMTTHFDTNFWGEDSEKFNPNRWEKFQYKNFTQYLAFGQGPRMCLGEKLAMLKLKIILTTLLKNYEIIAIDKNTNKNNNLMHKNLMVKLIEKR